MSGVHVETLDRPSISKPYSEIFAINQLPPPSWMDPFIKYLTVGELREDKAEAKRLCHRATLYMIRDGQLFWRGQSFPQLQCLAPKQGRQVLTELHSGVCGNHVGTRNLAFKALQTGYYWPTMKANSKAIVGMCVQCHEYANYFNRPSVPLSVIVSPVPFAQWGLDLIGELSTAQ
ncbi:uncharacterized protein LOC126787075 [Argentina anserina]|uniref:uncharacterized protein LOC126787075 n=1 Tax=Argentina anserina TaxID=57926 RepID=UPI00217695B0|nr:uncharacterized protein LOC126787075 [Potentilla anserina]